MLVAAFAVNLVTASDAWCRRCNATYMLRNGSAAVEEATRSHPAAMLQPQPKYSRTS